MQAIIAIPDTHTLNRCGGSKALMREVYGVPLLVRVIKTAVRAGVNSLLVIWPSDVPQSIWLSAQAALDGVSLCGIIIVQREPFEPRQTESWMALSELFEDRFLWLPWNWVTNKGLACLEPSEVFPIDWSLPIHLKKDAAMQERKIAFGIEPRLQGVTATLSRTTSQPSATGLVEHSIPCHLC